MIITHKIKKDSVKKNVFNTLDRHLSIFLLNKRGHYFSIPANPTDSITNMHGWYNLIDENNGNDYTLYKSIDNIYLSKAVTEIVNNYSNTERLSSDTVERFTLAKNGLIYEVDSYNEFIHLDLDFREIFNPDDKGRIYNIYKHEDLIIVEYTKYSDDSRSYAQRKAFLVIKGANDYELVNTWSQKIYHYDINRKNSGNFYIYNALKIPCRKNIKLYFAFAEDKDVAIQKLDDIFLNASKIEERHSDYVNDVLSLKNSIKSISGDEAAFAYSCSINAIEGLSMQLPISHKKITGMWAGLPWFFQYWSRDELISVMSLILEHRYDYSKELLMKYLAEIMSDGRLSNRYPAANLGNADGIGWLFKRLQGFLSVSEQRDNFHNYFSLYDLNYIRERLKFSIKRIQEKHSRDGLIINDRQETWMDTFNNEAYDKDFREGARIEIQALFLSQLKLLGMLENYLANKYVKKNDKLLKVSPELSNINKLEEDTKALVREKFLKKVDGRLHLMDGYDCPMDSVTRPNIFIAYYVYPELLSDSEWIEVFDSALPKLWCDWDMGEGVKGGGLSTIDKSHYLYQPYYTGIDNKSYHRGDSWPWINNIAAIAMHRLDKKRYEEYIKEIVTSSAHDILYWGFIGYASELASSGWFKSGGCLAQTWSIATYIELMHEMFIDN
ncbi:MAG TPA: amylo-alpha-1,6-glucosidase [Alphaproteobacteria bacterium]|nr:amylo-alpha-1,6-glucosidase [Alphaproteobacteria bacterium]